MAFVDPFLLAVTLVMTVILIIGNLYFVAKYAHPADSAFGSSTACKAIIVSPKASILFIIHVILCIIL
jgi:hypothetical protein